MNLIAEATSSHLMAWALVVYDVIRGYVPAPMRSLLLVSTLFSQLKQNCFQNNNNNITN